MSNIFNNANSDYSESDRNFNIINELSSELEFEKQYGGGIMSATSSVNNYNNNEILSDTSITLRDYSGSTKEYSKNNELFSATSSNYNKTGGAVNNELFSATSSNYNKNGGIFNNELFSATSSMKNIGGTASSTSSINNIGGNSLSNVNKLNNIFTNNIKNNKISSNNENDNINNDINQLLEMLTSESTHNEKKVNNTQTKAKQLGGVSNINEMKKYFQVLEQNGIDVKLNNMNINNFFNNMNYTTTELSNEGTDNTMLNIEKLLNSTTSEEEKLIGGARKKKEKKVKKEKGEKKSSVNPGLEAFNKLKNHIMNKLNIKSPIEGAKKASEIKKIVAEKHKHLAGDNIKLCNESIKYFDENLHDFK